MKLLPKVFFGITAAIASIPVAIFFAILFQKDIEQSFEEEILQEKNDNL